MSEIIRAVREVIQKSNQQSLKVPELIKHINRDSALRASLSGDLKKEDLLDVLRHYQKLSIIYIDDNENVLFL
jgi:hypothetical protein